MPKYQRNIAAYCIKNKVPVTLATQMLESMVSSRTPTCAEVNDITEAVFQGIHRFLLTGETANGIDPLNTIQTLKKIVMNAEARMS